MTRERLFLTSSLADKDIKLAVIGKPNIIRLPSCCGSYFNTNNGSTGPTASGLLTYSGVETSWWHTLPLTQ